MPKTETSSLTDSPVVKGLGANLGKIQSMRQEREALMNQMTNAISGGETNAELFKVYKGDDTKDAVFKRILGKLDPLSEQVSAQTESSKKTVESIGNQMIEFNSLKAGVGQDVATMKFFGDIDEGLKVYYENLNLLSNGAQFYKQMHQYLSSLEVFVTDFVQSRNLEKDELIAQLNAGGSGAPQGGSQAPGSAFLSAPYQAPRYQ